MSKINTTLIFISSILSIFCSPLIKDIFEIPKGTMEIYASIKRNQNFTVRLKSNHLIGNEWKLMNKDEANLRHVHPVNLIGNKNTVPFHKLDNYPERRLDDGYYDFQFRTTESLHHDLTLDLIFEGKQYGSTLSIHLYTVKLRLSFYDEEKEKKNKN
jgi:hypothetical protein